MVRDLKKDLNRTSVDQESTKEIILPHLWSMVGSDRAPVVVLCVDAAEDVGTVPGPTSGKFCLKEA